MQASDLERLKTELDGILAVVKKCPPDLQETAFKAILESWLADLSPRQPAPGAPPPPPPPPPSPLASLPGPFVTFTKTYSVTEEALVKVFHPVGAGAQLIAADLPGKGRAGKQINLALLIASANAMADGMFRTPLEELRQKSVHYGAYDATNFASTIRNSQKLFRSIKKGDDLELSGDGMKQAAEVIKGIASGAG